MLKIGVTGNIGAGKTQVCKIFELLNIPVYYADIRAKKIMVEDEELVYSIKELLGKYAYFDDGQLNRKFISDQIFKNREKLTALNDLVHPAVAQDFQLWCDNIKSPYLVKEAALLFEAGSYRLLDFNIVVMANQEKRLARVMTRDKLSREAVLQRMDKQMREEEKKGLADFIIDNNGSISLMSQVLKLHSYFLTNKNNFGK